MRIKRRVWIGLVVGMAAVGAWTLWARRHSTLPASTPPRGQPFVQLAGASSTPSDQVLREKAELLDPTPLFFPTVWNYGQRPLRAASLKQPGQVFGSFEPKLTVGEQNIVAFRTENTPVPEKLSDVLIQGNEAPFAGMGQVDRQLSTLPIRSGYVEVRNLETGKVIIAQTLTGITPPRSDFAPIEFIVVVGRGGLIGEPFLAGESAGDEVEVFFRDYLIRSYRLGERLRPGRYRVLVGV
jgi:hypothetical protein